MTTRQRLQARAFTREIVRVYMTRDLLDVRTAWHKLINTNRARSAFLEAKSLTHVTQITQLLRAFVATFVLGVLRVSRVANHLARVTAF